MNKFKKFLTIIISTIYPKKCICCGEIIEENMSLCENCNHNIERINFDDVCLECGFEKSDCSCKYNVYRFDGVVSAFKNQGRAQDAYYAYKFLKKQHYSRFFANEIRTAVSACYKDINFDLICYVPSFKKREYNHSGYIAKTVAESLNISFCGDLLSCIKKRKKQHKSTIKERINNVDGKYSANYRVDNKTVLLIDDIKTTGATLDECARVLLFAGAEKVYCATVLGSVAKKSIEK